MSIIEWKETRSDEASFDVAARSAIDGLVEWSATVKFDGCVHLHQHGPVDEQATPVEYLHLCGGVDNLIAVLTTLRDEARKHFGAAWPD